MDTQTHRITNRTKGSLLSEGVQELDATFEHLTVLRVLIEGLADNNEAGLWLTRVKGIPAVPRISPFDLIYVDEKQRVVEAVELLPAGEQPPFHKPAVSALVLPFQTISATQTRVGDQLVIGIVAEGPEAAEPEPETAHATAVETVPVAAVVEEKSSVVPPQPVAASIVAEAAPAAAPVTETAPAGHLPAGGRHAKSSRHGKKTRNTARTRRARRLAVLAERNREAAEVAQSRPAQTAPQPALRSAPAAQASVSAQPVAQLALPVVPQRAAADSSPPGASAVAAEVRTSGLPVQQVHRSRNANRPDAKSANERGNIMAAVNRFLHWLNPQTVDKEQRGSIRRPARELAAYGGPEGEQQKHEVGDISSTGVYLRTDERWTPGTKVALTLQRSGLAEHREDKRVEVEAEAVRLDKDGVALEFDFPEAMRLDLWEAAVKGESSESGPDYIVHEVRMARALGVFRSICPAAEEEVTRMLRKEFSSARVAGGIRIALIAERLLQPRSEANSLRAPAGLVLHILEMGSWSDEDSTQAMWAGLLASSCTRDGADESNVQFAEILSHLAPVHLRILWMACRMALTAAQEGTQDIVCTIGELTKGLDLTNLTKTLRTVSDLGDHGLMTAVKRSPSDPLDTEARTSATRLGLKMYARCHGQLGDEGAFAQAGQILPSAKA